MGTLLQQSVNPCSLSRKCLYVIKYKETVWDHPWASGSEPTEVRFYRRWGALWGGDWDPLQSLGRTWENPIRCARVRLSS